MSHASIATLLTVDEWAKVLGLNPWHFAQAVTSAYPPGGCDDVTYQFAWQASDKVSREDIALAIQQAEAMMAETLGTSVALDYVAHESLPYPRHHDRGLWGIGMLNARGAGKSLRLSRSHLHALGVEQNTLIAAGQAVAIAGGTGTVTVATSVADPTEIALYFRTVDGAPAAASAAYRIRPTRVSIAAGVATITADAWLFLSPSLQEAATAIDGDNAASFVAAVDVYRRYTDASDVGELVWANDPTCWPCTDPAALPCDQTEQTFCAWVRDWDRSLIVPHPASYDATTATWSDADPAVCRDPDRVRVNYLAGLAAGADNEMAPRWQAAVTYLALALLDRPLCACDHVKARTARWQEDLTLQDAGKGRSHAQNRFVDSCPWGTRAGAVYAWQQVMMETGGVTGAIAL